MLSFRDRRKISNVVFVILATGCFGVALIPLISILYETITRGVAAVSIALFTQVTPPIGGNGGGILNAIEGSLVMVGLSSLIGVPYERIC